MAVHASEETRRAQLLDAAKRCFAAKGYHETKVDDIVREAGLSKGALYWYFKSKEELLDELCHSFGKNLQAFFVEAQAGSRDPDYLIADLGATMLERVLSDPEHRLIWIEHWSLAARNPKSRKRLAGVYQGWLDIATPLIKKAVAEGQLKPVDPKQLLRGLMALFDGILILQAFQQDVDGPKLWKSLTGMLFEGIRT